MEKNRGPSWTIIVVSFVLFWPIGVYLLIRKLNADKSTLMSSGRKMTIWGWVIVVIGVISIANSFGRVIFFLFAGFALIYLGQKSSNNAEKYKRYIDLIVNQKMHSLSAISSAISIPEETLKYDVQLMIDKGYFEGAYINHTIGQIIFANKEQPTNSTVEMFIAICKSCGANNKVRKGQVDHCQYCDSFIEAEFRNP